MSDIVQDMEIIRALWQVYTPEGADIWLHARNRNLDGAVPVDLIQAGEGDRVLSEARRLGYGDLNS